MKLPELPYRAATPSLPSGEAARADNRISNIRAGVSAVGGVLNTLDREFEREARLDAMKRFNVARREYTSRVSELTTEFTADRTKTGEDFAVALQQAEEEVFAKARDGVSVRGQKYINADIDSYSTQTNASRVEAVRRLTQARTELSLKDLATESVAALAETPSLDTFEYEYATHMEALSISGLPAPAVEKLKDAYAVASLRTAINGMIRAGHVGSARELQDSEAYERLTPEARMSLNAEIARASAESVSAGNAEDVNAVVLGQMDMDTMFARVRDRFVALTDLTEREQDDAIRAAQGDAAFLAFSTRIRQGEWQTVAQELATGDYNDTIDPARMAQLQALLASARSAGGAGGVDDSAFNRYVAGLEHSLEQALQGLDAGGVPLTPVEAQEITARLQALDSAYATTGKTYPKSTEKLRLRVLEAVADQDLQYHAIMDPNFTVEDAKARRGDMTQPLANRVLEEKINYARNVTRPKLIAQDTIRMAEMYGRPVNEMPEAIGSDEWMKWLDERLNVIYPGLQDYFTDTKTAGPLSESEAVKIHGWMAQLQAQSAGNTSALIASLGDMATAVGDSGRLRGMFYQLSGGDDSGLMPILADMTAMGRGVHAENTLQGQLAIQNKDIELTGSFNTTMRAFLYDKLNNAYGDYTIGESGQESTRRQLVGRAVVAQYAYLALARGLREFSGFENDLAEQALENVTGGLVDVRGQTFPMPDASTTPKALAHWMKRQDSTTLPAMYDGRGNPIPAGQIDLGWRNGRFRFMPAGSVNAYVVQDAHQGEYVRNESGERLVVPYKPLNKTEPPASDMTRARYRDMSGVERAQARQEVLDRKLERLSRGSR